MNAMRAVSVLLLLLLFCLSCGRKNKTQVTVSRPVIDLGNNSKGMENEVSFQLKNTGRNPLILFEMQTFCGCTHATYNQQTTLTNGEILVTVKVVKEYVGSFSGTISI